MYRLPVLMLLSFIIGTLFADENLIANGFFTDSTAAHWSLASNGAQVEGGITNRTYTVSIVAPSSGNATPQLVHWGIALSANTGYLLQFRVSASDSGLLRFAMAGDGNSVFTDSAAGLVVADSAVRTYRQVFFVTQSTGNARLLFDFGAFGAGARVSLDSIRLVKNPQPLIRITMPVGSARWVSGSERQIQWQSSDDIEKVKILFSTDSGTAWSVIRDVASNQKSFWWQIPPSVAGSACRIIVSDTSGIVADTSEQFRIIPAGVVDAREMVKNGLFADTTDWRLSITAPAKASGILDNDEYGINITSAGGDAWRVKLEQSGFTLENGAMYRFSFDAYASHNRGIYANIGPDDGKPAWSVYGGDTIPVMITTTRTRYYQTIIMKYTTSENNRIEFNCGNDTGNVFIDNVSLIKLENSSAFITSPVLGAILKSGTLVTIEWQVREASTVDLEFSDDSGITWSTAFEQIENSGAVAWTVPVGRSERCFIRVRNAETDSVLGVSAQFGVNAFGAPVKSGELVVNGLFVNNLQGWNTSFNNAQGSLDGADGMCRIRISEPGETLAAIILSQSGIPVLKDQAYTLSYNAFTNGMRDMGVRVLGEEDTVTLVDTAIALPSVAGRKLLWFTARKDALVRLEFLMGGSRADIFLDDVSVVSGTLLNVVSTRAPRDQAAFFTARHIGTSVEFVNCSSPGGTVAIYTLAGALIHTIPVGKARVVWNVSQQRQVVSTGCYIAQYSAPGKRAYCTFTVK